MNGIRNLTAEDIVSVKMKYSDWQQVKKYPENINRISFALGMASHLTPEQSHKLLPYMMASKSQIAQDLFVLSQCGFKKNGFFIEFGATDGVELSNSYLLEKNFDWRGILAEPAKAWHEALFRQRGGDKVSIETDCVWTETGKELLFNETEDRELSAIDSIGADDVHRAARDKGKKYVVNSISLLDLCKKHNAPSVIDYLSIDTEGSELLILQAFDFAQYRFNIITCEHNYTPARDDIYNLLLSKGYKRVLEKISQWDDWYIWQG